MGPFSILSQRIVWPPIFWKGDVQDGIKKLLNDNLISPENPDRKMDGVVFKRIRNVPHREVYAEFCGCTLEEAVVSMCKMAELILIVHENGETTTFYVRRPFGSEACFDYLSVRPRV